MQGIAIVFDGLVLFGRELQGLSLQAGVILVEVLDEHIDPLCHLRLVLQVLQLTQHHAPLPLLLPLEQLHLQGARGSGRLLQGPGLRARMEAHLLLASFLEVGLDVQEGALGLLALLPARLQLPQQVFVEVGAPPLRELGLDLRHFLLELDPRLLGLLRGPCGVEERLGLRAAVLYLFLHGLLELAGLVLVVLDLPVGHVEALRLPDLLQRTHISISLEPGSRLGLFLGARLVLFGLGEQPL